MDNLKDLEELLQLLNINNKINNVPTFDKELIILKIKERIEHLFINEKQKLTFLFYKLDISEKEIFHAIQNEKDGTKKIATLIYERQLKKFKSRKKYTELFNKGVDQSNISEELKW